jgi:putative mRNA 3-end processing factor
MSIRWAQVNTAGLYCQPAGASIDPSQPSPCAIITHGHADHARAGHDHVIATPQTLDIMQARYGANFAKQVTALEYGERLALGEAELSFAPAGHVLGSAQAVLTFQEQTLVAAGDYKRKADPTCAPFEAVPCDVFVTEATFGLPVFRHPDPLAEIGRLLTAHRLFPERTVLIGAYALGKAQRIMALLREAGYNQPVYLHGAMQKLTSLYERWGVSLGVWQAATADISLAGKIVIAPPSAFGTSWIRRLNDPLICFASGWMQVRQRAKQRGVELPLILSDHADWDDLLATITEIAPKEVWVTHGREEALIHACEMRGITAKALSIIGYDEAET